MGDHPSIPHVVRADNPEDHYLYRYRNVFQSPEARDRYKATLLGSEWAGGPLPNIPKREINLGIDESGKKHTLRQGFSLKQPLQLERIDPLPLREIESSDTGDIDIRDIIRSGSISLPKGKEPQLIMKVSNKTRTGQEPAYYTYWDKDKKQWKRRPVEKEEYDYYMRKNRIRKPQIIKASF